MAKWKLVLSAVVIVAILVLVFGTNTSKRITNAVGINFDLGSISPQKILSSISTGFSSIINPLPSGDYFTFILDSEKNILSGKSFAIENGTVTISGNFISDVSIGDTVYDVSQTKGEVYIQNLEGTIEFGSYDTVIVSGKATGISVNGGTIVRPSGQTLSVKFEISPSEYFFAPIIQNNLKLANVEGKIERTNGKAASQELKGEDVEITAFIGSVKLSGGLILSGAAKAIKSKTFVWTG